MRNKTIKKPKIDQGLRKEYESLFSKQNSSEKQWKINGDHFVKLSIYGGYSNSTSSNSSFLI